MSPTSREAPPPLAPDLARLPITHNLRALSVAEGVRAALSVAVIIAISEFLNLPILREAALGALLTCLCDPGGPVRRRVPVLLSFALAGALVTGGFGLIRGLGPAVALPIGVLALFAASFARIYGQAPQQLGALLSTVIVLSLDRALPVPAAAQVAAAFAGGALWATLLTLAIWRLHPYRATRQAVAEVYHALAALTGDLHALLRCNTSDSTGDTTAWETHARAHRRAVREAIEAARATVLDTLRGRGAGNLRAAQSLIRLEAADQLFGAMIALSDLLEHGTTDERAAAERMLRRMRPLLTVLAEVARAETPAAHPGIKRSVDAMEAAISGLPPSDPLRAVADHIVERLRIAHTLAVPANFLPGADPEGRRAALRERLSRPLQANLTWRSPSLRHALRAAVMAAPALAFTMAWFTPYDHWLTITIVATMQPFFALTFARAVERIAGTAAGGLVAAAVGLLCTTPLAIAVAMFPLAVAALAVRAVNFGLFMLALTPVVVLLVETGEPDTAEWRIALARAALTIAGGLLAVAASFVLWPSREPERLVTNAQEAIGAHGRYAEAEFGSLLDEIPAAAVEPARRDAGVASNALEASINRALIERTGKSREMLEAVLVIDAALRRCAGRLAAMQLDPGMRAAMPAESLRIWRDWIAGAMRALASGRTELPPRPDTAAADAPRRIARQIELMAGAMRRLPG
jgi:uncharacterized membrane protein YccC